jgi:asparagine synthase (glutamine-hydrolysing)
MCGICGKVGLDSRDRIDSRQVKRMMDTLMHRGPDDEGIYDGSQAVLGHRRLSIIDLSTGKQPISNEDGTVWVVFNGEVYNFKDLRRDLIERGHLFKTNTDTEVIIHLYEQYGDECVSQLEGMFAFALWDERQRKLLLARDRVGIKPLYYCITNGNLLFASEIKALITDPSVKREVDPQVVSRFLTFLYTPGCETLIRGILKLGPGHYLVLKDGHIKVTQYWDLRFSNDTRWRSFKDATSELIDLLRVTVRSHMISDVPVGVLLSGGVDSTALLSFAVEQTDKEVNSFTIGFKDERFADERPYARLAAERFGNKHYETTITPQDFLGFLPDYVWFMEEPVCEPPAVALYYVTKLAREHVKVLISGEGGDEAFAGYQNYRNLIWFERLKAVAGPGNGALGMLLGWLAHVPHLRKFGKYSSWATVPLPEYYYSRTSTPYSFFNKNRLSFCTNGFRSQIQSMDAAGFVQGLFAKVRGESTLNQMLYVDTKTWLPDDLLVKADKITMANSVELRVPLLDHKVLEFAAGLPAHYKVSGFRTKHILKEAFKGRVPNVILNRKKTGFPVPVETWLRNDLRDYVREVLMDSKTLARGYFEKKEIADLLDANSRHSDHPLEVFSLLTIELWHRRFIDQAN